MDDDADIDKHGDKDEVTMKFTMDSEMGVALILLY